MSTNISASGPEKNFFVHPTIHKLLRLNQVEGYLRAAWPPGAQSSLAATAVTLRREIEPALLTEFERLSAAGGGVVSVIDGICQGCRSKLSFTARTALEHTSDLHRCESCGRFMYLRLSSSETFARADGVEGDTTNRLAAGNPTPTR